MKCGPGIFTHHNSMKCGPEAAACLSSLEWSVVTLGLDKICFLMISTLFFYFSSTNSCAEGSFFEQNCQTLPMCKVIFPCKSYLTAGFPFSGQGR